MKSTTGLSASEFNHLAKSFGQEVENEGQIRYEREVELGNRERKPGGGRIGNLIGASEKLFFILFYFKCYPTFDVLGLLFDLDRSNTCRNVQKLTPIWENVLGKKMVLPSRKINSLDELFEIFQGVKDLFIDGTERRFKDLRIKRSKRKTTPARKRRILVRILSSPIRTNELVF